jgi:hypothetical protein
MNPRDISWKQLDNGAEIRLMFCLVDSLPQLSSGLKDDKQQKSSFHIFGAFISYLTAVGIVDNLCNMFFEALFPLMRPQSQFQVSEAGVLTYQC